MEQRIKEYIKKNSEEMCRTLKELCLIPAPSHMEERRAEYCKEWLLRAGATGVYIDKALNVIFPLNCEGSNEITVFAAHTDTVFPDTEPMPYKDNGEAVHCPGVADDTASVVNILYMAKFFIENKINPEKGILFVLNSCEEGLGNLKGTRQLFEDFEGRIEKFITLDADLGIINDVCVGSERYEVSVKTEGGHSFGAFGNKNAIAVLSEMISEIYSIKIPEKEGTKTTYNVGTISGGTSVNTIAQNAEMLCEFRSDDIDCMNIMKKKFREIFDKFNSDDVSVSVKNVGNRPCSNTDYCKVKKLLDAAVPVVEGVTGEKCILNSSSTDCNIPLYLKVPAICVGTTRHKGTHTREELLYKKSLFEGTEIAIKLGLEFK